MKGKFWLLVLLLGTMLGVACGGGGGGEAETVTIEVVMKDIHYGETNDNQANPPVWTVTTGGTVVLKMTNEGSLEHNWTVMKAGMEVPMPLIESEATDLFFFDAGKVAPTSSSTISFTAPAEAGEYMIVCVVAGHYPLMQGRLVVNEAP